MYPLSIPSYYLEMERATRQYHPRRYILPTSSINIFQHSFYFRSICDWNALPLRLIDHDNIDQFTNEIQQIYYKSFCTHVIIVTMFVIATFS